MILIINGLKVDLLSDFLTNAVQQRFTDRSVHLGAMLPRVPAIAALLQD